MVIRTKSKGGQLTAFFIAMIFGLTLNLAEVTIAQAPINVMFYNVENLFDTLDHPNTYDEDFTPSGKLEYSAQRYEQKVIHIAQVIDSAFYPSKPDIIGLCEVENRIVVNDLCKRISAAQWQIVHFDSPDGRGIDNALIFNSGRFSLVKSEPIPVDLGLEDRPTRDILFVQLEETTTGEIFELYVNHWPSRYGGAEASNWKRMKASQSVQQAITGVGLEDKNVLVLGDFNDYPNNESILSLTNCDTGLCLQNLFEKYQGTNTGSYVYKGEWGVLDQILINKHLNDGLGEWIIKPESAQPFKRDFMLYKSEKTGDKYPSRTYGGVRYFGGFSDHLPVIVTLIPKS